MPIPQHWHPESLISVGEQTSSCFFSRLFNQPQEKPIQIILDEDARADIQKDASYIEAAKKYMPLSCIATSCAMSQSTRTLPAPKLHGSRLGATIPNA
jgi:hypothetical protein